MHREPLFEFFSKWAGHVREIGQNALCVKIFILLLWYSVLFVVSQSSARWK